MMADKFPGVEKYIPTHVTSGAPDVLQMLIEAEKKPTDVSFTIGEGIREITRLREENERLRGILSGLFHVCRDLEIEDDWVAQVFPDKKNRNGQPGSVTTKNVRKAMNAARAALKGGE